MKYNNFLVVGGAGFIGSHVVDALIRHGADKVVVVDNLFLGKLENLAWARKSGSLVFYQEDARYLTALENIIEREKPKAVFNLAVKCLPYGFIDPEGSFMCGLEIAHNLAVLLRRHKFQHLIHFSSSEVYGSALYVPMDELHPLHPKTPYGAGKAAADLLLLSYVNLFASWVSIIRPFNAYGPRQNMEAYAAVVPLTIKRILANQTPILEGDGNQTRDFTYVDDVAEAAVFLSDYDEAVGQVINVGQGAEIKIKDIIHAICNELNYPIENIEQAPERLADVKRLYASIDLAKKLINYQPKTSLKTGLQRTINWYKTTLTLRI